MITYEEIIDYCSNYKIEKVTGMVFDIRTNREVVEEEKVLKIKSAFLLFREAKDNYQNDISQFGKTNKSQEDYIRKTMEKFGTNNEENTFGINKLIRAILESSGHYEEYISGNDLTNTKFAILVEPKKDYGLAYLRLKFREKGLDIEDLNVSQDLTELQHNGVSKVIIDFKVKKYEKNVSSTNSQSNQSFYQHPRAKDLNELEKLKQIAKQENDQDGYNYAQINIERIIRENPAILSDEEFNAMFFDLGQNELDQKLQNDIYNDIQEKLGRIEAKERIQEKSKPREELEQSSNITFINNIRNYEIKEILNLYNQMILTGNVDDLELNNLIRRMETVREALISMSDLAQSEEEEKYYEDTINMVNRELQQMRNSKSKSNQSVFMVQINNLKQEINKIHEEYRNMFSDRYIDDEELDILINRMRNLSDRTISIQSMASNNKERYIFSEVIDEIDRELKKMIAFRKGIEDSIRRV